MKQETDCIWHNFAEMKTYKTKTTAVVEFVLVKLNEGGLSMGGEQKKNR